MKKITKALNTAVAILALGGSSLTAGEPAISGSLSLDANTHFISYGADVWGAGTDPDVLFNPSIGVSLDLGNGFTVNTGTWYDINDQAVSSLKGDFQEIDVWLGVSYAAEEFTFDVTFQQWYYASETEGILDFTISSNNWKFNPYAKAHVRIEGVGGQDEGAIFAFGGSHSFAGGDVSFSIPLEIAVATDDYHGGDSGVAYVTTGLGFSVPMSSIPDGLGSWDFHGGLNGYYTVDDVIPGNVDDTFLTFSMGVGVNW